MGEEEAALVGGGAALLNRSCREDRFVIGLWFGGERGRVPAPDMRALLGFLVLLFASEIDNEGANESVARPLPDAQ